MPVLSPARMERAHGACDGAAADGRCLNCEVRPISLCGVLDPHDLAAFAAMSERCRFAPRAPITVQGDRTETVYNIISGVVRVYSLLPDGRRQIVGFLLPGDFLGLALSERFAFCADAVTATLACTFRRADFLAFAERKPHLLRSLHAATAHELTVAQNHMVLLGQARAETKVLAFLMSLRERWARHCGKVSVSIPLPMGRADIGDYLGLTIETVSRTLNQLARQKRIVIVPNGVWLLDLPAIEAIIAGG